MSSEFIDIFRRNPIPSSLFFCLLFFSSSSSSNSSFFIFHFCCFFLFSFPPPPFKRRKRRKKRNNGLECSALLFVDWFRSNVILLEEFLHCRIALCRFNLFFRNVDERQRKDKQGCCHSQHHLAATGAGTISNTFTWESIGKRLEAAK